jgi:hypothetical protein
MGVAFVIVGPFLLLPREVNTIFDLRSRRVLHNVGFCKGLYERRQAHSFDEIAGLSQCLLWGNPIPDKGKCDCRAKYDQAEQQPNYVSPRCSRPR